MTGLPRPAVVGLFFALVTPAASAQQPTGPTTTPPAVTTGLVLGRTVDGSTGRPVGGVEVTLNLVVSQAPLQPGAALGRGPVRVLSDANGQFVLRDLPGGTFSLTGTKAGHVTTALGRRSAADTSDQLLVLAQGEARGDVVLRLWRFAVIAGSVTDEAGEAVVGLPLRVFRRSTTGGRVQYSAADRNPTTDDRGDFRAGSLVPGDYVVGIVTTQVAVPASLGEVMTTATTAGTADQLRRELARSQASCITGSEAGQRVGDWVLQTRSGSLDQNAVAPRVQGDKVFVYPSVFYPAAAAIGEATTIRLASGEERSAVDFRVRSVPASRISGHLLGPKAPEPHAALSLVPASANSMARENELQTASTMTDANGAFTFLGVPAGSYEIRSTKIPLRAESQGGFSTVIQTGTTTIFSETLGPRTRPPIPDDPTLWARVPVTVTDSDVTGVAVSYRTGGRVTGRLAFEGSGARPDPAQLSETTIRIEPAWGNWGAENLYALTTPTIDDSGAFKSYQLPAGQYVIRALDPPESWTFKGAFFNGRDLSDEFEIAADDVTGVVVTYTDRPIELSGTVRTSTGLDPSATVVVFPAQAASGSDPPSTARRLRTARVKLDGTYRITGLPAGDYIVVAVAADDPVDWHDPAWLRRAAALGAPVTLAGGEKKRQDIQTREVR